MEVTRSRYRILIRKPVLKRQLRRPRITWVPTAATYQTIWGTLSNTRTYISHKFKEIIQNMPNIYTELQPRLWWYIVSLADLPTSLVTSCRPTFRINIGWLSAKPLTDLLPRLFSLSQVSQSSFSVGIVTTSRVSAVYTLNTDPKINAVNSEESFLTTTCKHDNNFKKRRKVWSNRIKSRQKKNIQNTRAEEKLDKMSDRLDATLKKKNCWFDLRSKRACLHRQQGFQQNYCTYSHTKQLWLTNSTTHIVNQEGTLRNDTSMRYEVEKHPDWLYYLVTKLDFISVETRM